MNVLNVEVQGVRIVVISGNPKPPESSPLDQVSYSYCIFPDGVTSHEYQARWEKTHNIPPDQVIPMIENLIVADGRK
jgi:hypothetical protein